jgi:hypothetical protein
VGCHTSPTACALALAVAVALAVALSPPFRPSIASAQSGAIDAATGEVVPAPTAASRPIRTSDQRRALPDYDGLPAPGPAPEEVAIWVPRIVLAPLYLVSEFVVRRPLGAFLTWAERESVHTFLVGLFTWDHRRAGLVPVAFFDFGLMPSVGLYFFWNDLGAPGHQLRFHAGFGGVDWLRATIRDRVLLHASSASVVELSFRAEAWRWPDRVYQGIGAQRSEQRARFRQEELTARVDLALSAWRRSGVLLGLGIGAYDFDADGYDLLHQDRSLANAIAEGTIGALPDGFDGYVAYRQRIRATLDTRERAPRSGHGVRVDVSAEQGFDLRAPVERRWLRWGATLSGYVDAGAERVFSLHVRALFAESLGTAAIPFPELIQLGNDVLELPGFLRGSLADRSAVVATLRYRWPVWVWLDGTIYLGIGSTFGEHLRDFAGDRLRMSWGLGVQSTGDRDSSFRLSIAFGTRSFGRGADIESVRFAVGSDLGF